ncbi:MAG: hypothetical protein HND40_13220 [Ignavibacteriota bacterium]|nr:hypothetical protein [Ignavibacterium album]MCZ2270242.1 hypothetical protein [Ignavibacteriales bacterium]QKK00462.1 MAG: hypothetical protein HND40_13220 [Ignavibacteriota bacterium]
MNKRPNQEIVTDAATTYSWETEYYNNGNGKIEGWNIRTSDRFIPGYYYYGSGTTAGDEPLMMVIHPNDFYGIFNKVGHFSDFNNYSSIGGWNISTTDKYSSYVGNGNRPYLLAVNHSSHWAALLYNHPVAGWMSQWTNSGNDWIGGWSINSEDYFVSGKFNPSDPSNQQVLALNYNTHWASLLSFSGSWISPWSNSGTGGINGWNIANGDRYYASDFDGDGFDELLCIKAPWAAILKFNGSNWTWLWSNSGNNSILGWIMNNSDKYSAGNIISSNVKHEFIISNASSGHAVIFCLNQSTIQSLWGNGGNHYIGPHYIDAFDQYFVINGLGSSYSSLMAINLVNARTLKLNVTVAQDDDETAQ